MRSILVSSLLLLAASLPSAAEKWYEKMRIGPAWSNTFADTYRGEERVAAAKGILIDMGLKQSLFDTETLLMVTTYDHGIIWGGTPWRGSHGQLVKLDNAETAIFNNAAGPGWADESGSFADPREEVTYALYTHKRHRTQAKGAFGSIPHLKFSGFYRHGSRIILDYEVHGTRVLDSPYLEYGSFFRSLKVTAHDRPLLTRIADDPESPFQVRGKAKLVKRDGKLLLEIPPSTESEIITLSQGDIPDHYHFPDEAFSGGEGLWRETLETTAKPGRTSDSAWVADTVSLPKSNPWDSNLRFAAFDFLDEDRAAICTWNGDVWIVSGLKEFQTFQWRRFASGLFEPLGLKVIDDVIHVHGRDQITRLHDLNSDQEADHYEVFHRSFLVSPNFHEFAFDLHTDAEGAMYVTKASPVRPGGRNFDVIMPHHGTVMKISPDGSELEVIASGIRAPGGLGLGPNGEITTGENEGTWQPCCKINFMRKDQRPLFFGTEPTRQGIQGEYAEPLCYLPMDIDNSGGSQVWVPEGSDFGLKPGELIHLSYGKSALYRVFSEEIDGMLQGGVARIPVKLLSSAMRARFHADGSLYVAGFRGWQTNAATPSAFQRIRPAGNAVTIPNKLETTATGLRIRFDMELDRELATDLTSYSAQRWDYVRGPQYGSGEFSVDHPDIAARELALRKESKGTKKRDTVRITAARLLEDGRTVEVDLEGHKPSMQLKLSYDLESRDGIVLIGDLHSTIHRIPSR